MSSTQTEVTCSWSCPWGCCGGQANQQGGAHPAPNPAPAPNPSPPRNPPHSPSLWLASQAEPKTRTSTRKSRSMKRIQSGISGSSRFKVDIQRRRDDRCRECEEQPVTASEVSPVAEDIRALGWPETTDELKVRLDLDRLELVAVAAEGAGLARGDG